MGGSVWNITEADSSHLWRRRIVVAVLPTLVLLALAWLTRNGADVKGAARLSRFRSIAGVAFAVDVTAIAVAVMIGRRHRVRLTILVLATLVSVIASIVSLLLVFDIADNLGGVAGDVIYLAAIAAASAFVVWRGRCWISSVRATK